MALDLDRHLTIFAGSLDTKTNKLRYTVASHMPMPFIVTSGNVIRLKGRGKPVGIFRDAEWKVEEVELPSEFLLTLVSDGVLEVFPNKSLKDKEKIISNSIKESDGSVGDICKKLGLSQIKDIPDDVTILTIRKKN
jgi:serine phosphatase RsbU (regulator of sigma subunit)